jgi:ABC-2 type transport system permease protein
VNATYLVFETKRMLRNRRVLIFSMVLPSVLLLFLGHAYGDAKVAGVGAPEYFMVSMAILGVMANALSGGGSIAVERGLGWNRQLLLTPLRPISYVITKVLMSVLIALGPLLATFLIGKFALHIQLTPAQWASTAGLVILSCLPFAALGVAVGYFIKAESAQQVVGLINMALALLGGIWFPVTGGVMKTVAQFTPSYWAAQLARGPITDGHPSGLAFLVIAAWTVGLGFVAFRRFQVAGQRV